MEPMSVLEALAVTSIGWREEWQHEIHNEARRVLWNAGQAVYERHRKPAPSLDPIIWTPSEGDKS
jgi:hypothetical protein